MRKALVIACALLAATGPAASQAPKPAPAEEPVPAAERPAAPGPRLNLKLDNPSQYLREIPQERRGNADGLPSLGADARPLPASTIPAATETYPKDTQQR